MSKLRISSVLIAIAILSGVCRGALAKGDFDLQQCDRLDPATADSAEVMSPIKLASPEENQSTKPSAADQAASINAMPIQLMAGVKELQDSDALTTEAENQQLKDLWTATIQRSPDIQFVVDRLQPKSDKAHDSAHVARLISNLLNGVGNIASSAAPTAGSRILILGGSSLLDSLLPGKGKQAQQDSPSHEQLIVLYKMVHDTADKLVADYRQYRKAHNELTAAEQDLDDARALAAATENGSKGETCMINFTVRLADRNAKQAEANFHIAQQQLADLAGVDAIAKLEDQVAQEQTALHNLVGKPDVLVPPLALPSVKSAQGKQ